MRGSRAAFWILLCALSPSFVMAAEEAPPTSATVHLNLEKFWSSRQFDKLDAYVEEIDRAWGPYVPVRLARATYSYKCEMNTEAAIRQLETLRVALIKNIEAASPIFMELLDSRILRYRELAHLYSEKGYTQERLLKMFAPRIMDASKLSKHWGEDMLFFNAPEVFLMESGVQRVTREREAAPLQSNPQATLRTLQHDVGDEEKPMTERTAFAQELVRRRIAEGGVRNLVQSLPGGDSPYTYQETVEELAKAGRSAVPAILEYLNSPASFARDQKMAIWALVRIAVADDAVIQALQAVSANTDRADLARYAQDALQYLQSRNR